MVKRLTKGVIKVQDNIKIAIIGCGARGKETYGRYAMKKDSGLSIVAVCDNDPIKLESAKEEFDLSCDVCFEDYNDLFSLGKIADCVIIANYDQEHFDATIKAINLGYDILLEKPISNNLEECIKIRNLANEKNVKVIVCHVMRYTSYYMYLKKLLKDGVIGDLVAIEQTEDVGYWHMAHAFVRGNFRNSDTTSPMILQKCCHDFDLIMYLTEERPVSLTSFGGLRFFNNKNCPKNATDYCIDCKEECVFNAVNFYVDLYKDKIKNNLDPNVWPLSQVAEDPTEEKIIANLRSSNWGKCVFKSDNNVVDHQFTTMRLEKGTIATLTMIGFSNDGGRQTHCYGTKGEIYLDEQRKTIEISIFGQKKTTTHFAELSNDFSGHGGGDNEMMREFVECMHSSTKKMTSSIDLSVDSHILAFASEYSRLNNSVCVDVKKFEKGFDENEI